ncbi:MAG: SufE family protein [Candidatus Shikimatogenerans bostrichidophilus]|nr:MAG: SufE family protein [Candidatus Shikimatogenerans bostrichidophilus]
MLYKKILKKINNNKIYNYLIKLGKKLPYYPKKYKKNKYLLKNCLTNVWLFIFKKKNKIYFIGKSDSNIINGIIFLIIKIYSNKTPFKIINDKNNLFEKINLNKILSINKYIGTFNIINAIKSYSLKFIKNKS